MVDMAHYAGLVAAGLHNDPVPVSDFVTTTTHKTLRGPRGGMILCKEAYAKDIDRAVFPGIQGGPLMHVIAGKAVCFGEALSPAYKAYIQQVVDNAKTLAEVLTAGGVRLVSGGTDNHLMLADVTPLGLSGGQAEKALDHGGITVNKNMIPFDQRKPMDPSGVRIGTPAITSRGMRLRRDAHHRRLDPRSPPRTRPAGRVGSHPRQRPRVVPAVPGAGGSRDFMKNAKIITSISFTATKMRGYIADIPDLDACSSFGNTPEEALAELEKAKEAWLGAARELGKPSPAAAISTCNLSSNSLIF